MGFTKGERSVVNVDVSGPVATRLDGVDSNISDILAQHAGKKVKVVTCILRNSGTGWGLIDDYAHDPIGVSSVTNSATQITVNYDFVGSKVLTFVATPDETLAEKGYVLGASVLADKANIRLQKLTPATALITNPSGVFTAVEKSPGVSISWDDITKRLRIVHPKMLGYDINVQSRNGLKARMGSPLGDSTSFNVEFYKTPYLTGYIRYDGTSTTVIKSNDIGIDTVSWDATNQRFKVVSFDYFDGYEVTVTSKSSYKPVVKAIDGRNIYIEFYNGATKVTTPDTNMSIFLTRRATIEQKVKPADGEVSINVSRRNEEGYLDPNDVVEEFGNIWCYGVIEV